MLIRVQGDSASERAIRELPLHTFGHAELVSASIKTYKKYSANFHQQNPLSSLPRCISDSLICMTAKQKRWIASFERSNVRAIPFEIIVEIRRGNTSVDNRIGDSEDLVGYPQLLSVMNRCCSVPFDFGRRF